MYPRSTLNCLIAGACYAASLFVAVGAVVCAGEVREWSDASGKFKIKASFVSSKSGTVTLEKEGGGEVEIELKKLSAADQKFIADLDKPAEENPFKPKEENPFKSKPDKSKPDGTPSPAKPEEATKPVELKVVVPDFSDAVELLTTAPDMPWKFDPPDSEIPRGESKRKPISLPRKSDFFEATKGFVGSPSGKVGAIGYSAQKPGPNQPATTRILVCSLETSKLMTEATAPGKYIPLAIHNDGKTVLVKRDEFGFGNQDRLELWQVASKTITRTIQWVPYDDGKGGDRDVSWGSFLGDDRMITVSNKGRLIIWSIDEIKPLLTMDIQSGGKPAISPDQKYVAFSTGKDVAVLDLAREEVVATLSIPAVQWPAMAFSTNRKRLAMAAFDRLFVWDFATGDLCCEMPYQGINVSGNITWTSDEHVLLGNRFLIDVDSQVKLWDYQGAEFALQLAGITWFVFTDGHQQPGALLGAQLPPASVKDALAKAMSEPDFFVLQPGTTVRIDVSGVDAAGRDFAEKALTARLKDAGFEVGPKGTILLVAQTEVGKERQVSFHSFGRFGSQNYTVRDYFSRVKFIYNGQEVWQTSTGNVPGIIHLSEGETIEQYLKKSEKFNFDWFGKLDLPKLLQKPSPAARPVAGTLPAPVPTVGSSKLSTAGIP